MKYRHLPSIVEAEQFWPDQHKTPKGVMAWRTGPGWIFRFDGDRNAPAWVEIEPGDYVVKFTTGCRRKYKQADFEELYEYVPDDRVDDLPLQVVLAYVCPVCDSLCGKQSPRGRIGSVVVWDFTCRSCHIHWRADFTCTKVEVEPPSPPAPETPERTLPDA